MVHDWLLPLLQRLPGRPLWHCYLLMALSALWVVPGFLDIPGVFFTFTSLCFASFLLLIWLPLHLKELVDLRDHLIVDAIAIGLLAGAVVIFTLMLLAFYFLPPATAYLFWLRLGVSILLPCAAGGLYFLWVPLRRTLLHLPNWNEAHLTKTTTSFLS